MKITTDKIIQNNSLRYLKGYFERNVYQNYPVSSTKKIYHPPSVDGKFRSAKIDGLLKSHNFVIFLIFHLMISIGYEPDFLPHPSPPRQGEYKWSNLEPIPVFLNLIKE